MMNIPSRYWIPVLAALLLTAAIGMVLLWHVRTSIGVIERAASVGERGREVASSFLPATRTGQDRENETDALRHLRQGEVYVLQGELQKAEDELRESARLGGGLPALRKLAHVQLQRRNFSAAGQTITRVRREGGHPDDVLLLEALLELRRGNVPAAERILGARSETPQGQYGLALIAIAVGEHARAKGHLERVAEGTDPSLRSAATTLQGAYGEFALFENGREIHLATLLARALAQVQECETGLKLLRHVVSQKENYRDAWIVKGYCELVTERFAEALSSLEEAYNIDPEKPETQYFLARTYFMLGDPQNAMTFLQYAVLNGFEPEQDARLLLAKYALELGNTGVALEQYLALAEAEHGTVGAYDRYVSLALQIAGHEEQAYGAAREAVGRWPDDPHALTLLARTERALGLHDEARQRLDSVLRLHPAHEQARALLEEMRQQ